MNKFKELRSKLGITQEEFRQQFNNRYGRTYTAAAISQFENGKRTPETSALIDFANFFNVSIDYLLGNEPPKQEYYHDPEVAAIAQEMHDNPEIKVLFHATKGMNKESIEEIRKFVEFQKMKENGFME